MPDFNAIGEYSAALQGYDACFYCAGVSSVGMNETDYTRITYDTTLNVARVLAGIHPGMVFTFVTGSHTDTNGKQMWQRVKGRTEDELVKLGFRGQYNFRPGVYEARCRTKKCALVFQTHHRCIPAFVAKVFAHLTRGRGRQ